MREKGFTLLELTFVLVIGGMILAFMVPGFMKFKRDLSQKQVRATLLEDIRIARQLAITEHAPVVLAFGNGSTTTDVTTYNTHIDTDADRYKDSNERAYPHTLATGQKFTMVSLVPPDSLIFDISGVLYPGTSGGFIAVYGPAWRAATISPALATRSA